MWCHVFINLFCCWNFVNWPGEKWDINFCKTHSGLPMSHGCAMGFCTPRVKFWLPTHDSSGETFFCRVVVVGGCKRVCLVHKTALPQTNFLVSRARQWVSPKLCIISFVIMNTSMLSTHLIFLVGRLFCFLDIWRFCKEIGAVIALFSMMSCFGRFWSRIGMRCLPHLTFLYFVLFGVFFLLRWSLS